MRLAKKEALDYFVESGGRRVGACPLGGGGGRANLPELWAVPNPRGMDGRLIGRFSMGLVEVPLTVRKGAVTVGEPKAGKVNPVTGGVTGFAATGGAGGSAAATGLGGSAAKGLLLRREFAGAARIRGCGLATAFTAGVSAFSSTIGVIAIL